ncbi:MAG: N-acetyltransferase [Anaerolineales bacterium]
MPELQITAVSNKSELEQFITFPWQVYKANPHWVPPLISERKRFLDPDHNPFFEHAKATFYLARRNGRLVGTIGAFSNQLYNQVHKENSGFFGFYEVLDDPETARELLTTAEAWGRQAGHDRLLGPMQYSTNDELGLLIDGFDDPPRILMTYNPPRYRGYLEEAGYLKAMDLLAYSVNVKELHDGMPEKVGRVGQKILKRWDLLLRRVNMKDFDREVDRVKEMYNASWELNWGFVPMTDHEVDLLAKQLKSIIDPELALILEKEGRMVGFAIALPDLNQPLRLAYPRPGTPEFLTLAKLLWHWKVRKAPTWVRVWALGIVPEYLGQGLEALVLSELVETAYRKGYQFGEMSWILETNDKVQRTVELMHGKVYKTYRVYQKPL